MNKHSMLKVVIPSATLMPKELQNIGKLPGIIYPVGQRIVFDYLFEQYRNRCNEIRIICHDAADKVFRRLSMHINDGITLKRLPQLGDLGYTLDFALDELENPIVINFADTIVLDDITAEPGDAFFYSEDYTSDIWTFFKEKDGIITDVQDKVLEQSEEKGKLFVGVFKIIDTRLFKECLEKAIQKKDGMESAFYSALRMYSKKHPMKAIKTEHWFDIGHYDTYFNTTLEVRAREFNHIAIDKNRGILRKTSEDKDKFIGEIKWYIKLPSDVEYVRPRIFDYSTAYSEPYISMEYYAYHTLHELFLYGDLTLHQWRDIFYRIKYVCNDFKRYTVADQGIKTALEDMYLKKTLQRLKKMKGNINFSAFFDNPVTINHAEYLPLNSIIGILTEKVPALLYDQEQFQIIHGDLCFSNIMVDNNFSFIKVIDPRGKFGEYDIYGDFRYELAKLFHSMDGKYDFIIKDFFTVEYDLKGGGKLFYFRKKTRL